MSELRAECLRAFRRLSILAVAFLALVAALTGLLAWRLARGPLDLTPYAARWMPLALTQDAGHGARARLVWRALSVAWENPTAWRNSRLVLRARDLAIRDGDGTMLDAVGHAELACLVGPLLQGRVAPISVNASDAMIRIRRDSQSRVDFDFPGHAPGGKGGVKLDWSALREVAADHVQIGLRDVARPGDNTLRIDRLRASRPGVQWLGQGDLDIATGSGRAKIAIEAHPEHSGDTGWSAHIRSENLAGFARSPLLEAPISTQIASWDMPGSIALSGHLGVCRDRCGPLAPLGLALLQARAEVTLGEGHLLQPGAETLHVHGASATLMLDRPAEYALSITRAQITLGDPGVTYRAEGRALFDALPAPSRLTFDATASASPLDFATLADSWPRGIIKGARKWMTRNIHAGRAEGLQVHVGGRSDSGLEALRITTLEGHVTAQDLQVSWLAPIAPAEHISADAHFDGSDTLDVHFFHGSQPTAAGPLAIPSGDVRIDGILQRRQTARITLDASGDIARFLALLSEKRLNLLSQHPLPFTEPSGPMEAHLGVVVPLLPVVHTRDIGFDAQASFSKIHLGNVVLGRPTDDGEGRLHATPEGLDVVAHNRLSGVPTDVSVHEDFTPAPVGGPANRIVEHIHAVSHLDPQNAVAAGVAPDGVFTGHALLTADFDRQASGHADLGLALDLADAGIDLPFWTKPAGIGAQAQAHLAVQDGAILAADQITATGPGLAIAGHSLVSQGTITAIALDRFQIGRSVGRAVIGVPTGTTAPIPVRVDASVLDLAPLIHAPDVQAKETGAARRQRGWVVDCRAARVFFSATGQLGGVAAHLENDGVRLARGTVAVEAPTPVQASLTPEHAGGRSLRHLSIAVENIGHLMQVFGVTDRIDGGHARLDGDFLDGQQAAADAGTPPFNGALDVANFAFLRPPVALTAASKLSVYDWKAATMRRFEVTQMHLSLHLVRPLLQVSDGHLGNDALGATITGQADLGAETLALRGTIVPVFAINALPGRLPGVGKVFSPEKGGGLIATTFRIEGPMSNPAVHVQPLSMLLPGVLRKLVE